MVLWIWQLEKSLGIVYFKYINISVLTEYIIYAYFIEQYKSLYKGRIIKYIISKRKDAYVKY